MSMNKDWSKMSISTGKKNLKIYLDDKPLLSIEKKKLEFKNKKIALLLKEEIESSRKNKNFNKLFYFNILSFGIDKVKNNKIKYLNEIFKYIDTDLICYRAEKPDDLVELQIKMWNPVLDRLAKEIKSSNKRTVLVFKEKDMSGFCAHYSLFNFVKYDCKCKENNYNCENNFFKKMQLLYEIKIVEI